MNIPQELTRDVTFEPGYGADLLEFDTRLGFMKLKDEEYPPTFVGFAAPYSKNGGYDVESPLVHPITELEDVPKEFRNVDLQGKGVGPRVFNTLEASAGMPDRPLTMGLYAFNLYGSRFVDYRDAQGSKIAQVFRHAYRMAKTKAAGLDKVVNGVHRTYEKELGSSGVDAVLLNMPPHPDMRRAAHGLKLPYDIQSGFMIIRSSGVALQKIGSAPSLV